MNINTRATPPQRYGFIRRYTQTTNMDKDRYMYIGEETNLD